MVAKFSLLEKEGDPPAMARFFLRETERTVQLCFYQEDEDPERDAPWSVLEILRSNGKLKLSTGLPKEYVATDNKGKIVLEKD
ncbi:hypothetical protein [Bremerella sp. P1]|uniref:hypothetical protein n=1 Tax=Bremerella sp. P1 TaxID=3026424 RepID=UPI002368DE6F|nr:hypothetical protein [Bremerella sp. P1]WDI44749.1 hypothetical protein PSR63_12465 [Bremerella sp. P1]